MRLTTPIGDFFAHFYQPAPHELRHYEAVARRLREARALPKGSQNPYMIRRATLDLVGADLFLREARRVVVASLHRGPCPARAERAPCAADSVAVAEITVPQGRPHRLHDLRVEALSKAMSRLGLSREERRHLWASYFAQVAGPLERRCVAVVTTCPVGHRHRVEPIALLIGASFPSAREFCGAMTDYGHGPECEQPTIARLHRYLYEVALPLNRRDRQRQAAERAKEAPRVALGDPSTDDIPF